MFVSEITYRSEQFSYVGKHGYFSNGLENHGNVVAWMPLPNGYVPDINVGKMEETLSYADQDTMQPAT